MKIVLGLLTLDLELPQAHSLKEKRSAIRSLLAGIRNECGVGALEAGFQNRIRSCTIAIALVGSSEPELQQIAQTIRKHLDRKPDIELVNSFLEFR